MQTNEEKNDANSNLYTMKNIAANFESFVINMQRQISMSNLFHICILTRELNIIPSKYFCFCLRRTVEKFQIFKQMGLTRVRDEKIENEMCNSHHVWRNSLAFDKFYQYK